MKMKAKVESQLQLTRSTLELKHKDKLLATTFINSEIKIMRGLKLLTEMEGPVK
jgi:hypothetical protein